MIPAVRTGATQPRAGSSCGATRSPIRWNCCACSVSSTRPDELLAARDTGFPLRVPRGFVARMRHGDPDDPLLLQVLPRRGRTRSRSRIRPRCGRRSRRARGARACCRNTQGRALLIATGSCAVHCRYCFRRHFPYAEQTAAANRWQAAIAHLRGDASISEVILSGGDPLSLSTPKLAELTDALADIPHVRRLRIHTRLPIVLPERVDAELLDWLRALPCRSVVVLHANHANEIDESVADACARLREAGATLLNQSVLLRGINDSVDALGRPVRAPVRLRRPALLPAPARPGSAAPRISRSPTSAPWPDRASCASACRAIWCRDWCGKLPARRARRPVSDIEFAVQYPLEYGNTR